MVSKLYVIFDKLAEESSPIFQAKNDAVAMRMYLGSPLPDGAKREDFILRCVGEYDHELCQTQPALFDVEIVNAEEAYPDA